MLPEREVPPCSARVVPGPHSAAPPPLEAVLSETVQLYSRTCRGMRGNPDMDLAFTLCMYCYVAGVCVDPML